MKSILKKVKVLSDLRLLYHLRFSGSSYLEKEGFFTSYYNKFPTDKKEQLLPWMNYGVISFLKKRLHKNLTLFEYGSGSSTLFYSQLVKQVYSLEHDEEFFRFMVENYPQIKNNLIFEKNKKKYPSVILGLDEQFDVIVIDGIERCNCLDYAIKKLSSNGVIIFDDTDRKAYWKKIESLLEEQFKELTFVGLKPGGVSLAQTSIIYRPENCLNI